MNMPARGMERQRNRRWAGLLVLLLLVGMLCLAGTLFFERLTGAGQARFVPVQLHSALAANYRIDFAPPRLPPVRPEIIWDAILDNEGIAISAARKAGLLDVFQLPVPFVASPVCQGRHVIEAGRDTWLDSASPATVYGRDTVLQLGRQGNQLKRILLYFPLDESLRGASIYRASLELRVAGGPGIDTPELRLANLAAPFNETATNWSNQPDPFLNYRSLPLVIAESHTWDVTDMAQAWLLDRYPNHGLMLEPQSAKDFTIFYYSREAGQQTGGGPNPANGVSPRLIIDCSGPTPEPEAVVAAPSPTLAPPPTNTPPIALADTPTPQVTPTLPQFTPSPTLPAISPTPTLPASVTPPPTTTPPSPSPSPPAPQPTPTPSPTHAPAPTSAPTIPPPTDPPPTSPPPGANLALGKTGAPNPVVAGGNLTYSLNLTNNGPASATNVTVVDILPANVILVSATPGQGSCSGAGTVTCNLGTVTSGGSASITIVVAVDVAATGALVNSASVAAAQADPDLGNNTASVTTNVTANANLAIGKTAAPDPVLAGGNVTYTLTITNYGPANATGVTVVDTLPAGVTLVSATPSQGSCLGLTCSLGTLANGGGASVTIVAAVGGSVTGVLVNSANVTANEADPDPGNNTANASITAIWPSLSINDVAVLEGDVGTTNAVFTVTLSTASPQNLSVDYATADGTATVGNNDYVAIPTTPFTFLAGITQQTITVLVNGDLTPEPNETFFVNLTNPVNVNINDNQGAGNIIDDDIGPTVCSSPTLTLTATVDTSIRQNQPDTPQEGDTVLQVRPDEAPANTVFRSLVQFDLSTIPATTTLVCAALLLDETSTATDQIIYLHRLSAPWTAAETTWNNRTLANPWATPGGDYVASPATSFVPDILGLREIEVTALAQYWVTTPGANFGLLLRSTRVSDNADVQFRSLEAGTNPPRLILQY